MIAIRLAISELRRISAGSLPKLAVLAMIVIPSLYAGLYVYANKDPYGALHRVPAALVVEDQGATLTDSATGRSRQVDYGEQVARRLLDDDGGFGWVERTKQEAQEGVRSGRYDAALIIGPSFSENLTSSSRFEPRQASLDLLTNDATNYLATTIAKTVADDVRRAITQQVGTKAARTFLQGLGLIRTDLTKAVRGSRRLANGTQRLARGTTTLEQGAQRLASGAARTASGASQVSAGAARLDSGTDRLEQGSRQLASGLDELERRTASLPADTRKLADGARQVAAGNARIAAVGQVAGAAAHDVVRQVRVARSALETRLDRLVEQGRITRAQARQLTGLLDGAQSSVGAIADRVEETADRLGELGRGSAELAAGTERLEQAAPTLVRGVRSAASGGDRLASGAGRLAAGTGTLASGATQLASGTGEVSSGAGRLANGTGRLDKGAARLESGAAELHRGLRRGLGKVPDVNESSARATARTIGDPVAVRDDTLAQAGSYGAGLAPFFMSLAAWIGAYMLFLLVRPLSARALAADGPPGRTALGGMLPPAVVGVVQVAVMFTIVRLALDIDPAHELATALVLMVTSATFVAILQALNAWLGTVGEFLGLVLMLTQLVTAGGTFPWETIPQPLRALHWFLPMTYGVDSLRQTLYGGELSIVARNLGVLAAVCLVSLVATAVAARRQKVWTPQRLQPELVL